MSTQHHLNKPKHTAEFRRRRAINWLVLGFTYAAMYMGRYNLAMANPYLSEAYGWDKTDIGKIISGATLIYGLSAIFNGPIADRIGGRRAMLIGAGGTVVFNLAFGLGAYLGLIWTETVLLTYLTTVWSLCAYFQSYSALALIKVNAGWFHISERGVFSAIFGSMIQSGRFLILSIGGVLVATLPWQWVFFVPAGIVFVMFIMTYLFVRNGPEECGFPELETHDASSGHKGTATLTYVLKKVFTSRVALTVAAAEFCTGFVRHGFEQWFPRYMKEHLMFPMDSAIFQKNAGAVVIAGIVGAFAAGTISDIVFKTKRFPVALIGYAMQMCALTIVWMSPSVELIIAAFVVNSFSISMVHSMLSGTASMDFGGKKAAATAAGFFDGMQYVGGAFTGVGLGMILDSFGWTAWAPSMIGFSAIGFLLMLTILNERPKGAGGH
jgi:MFS transporter, OPA family, glycerol-3-phosphate transporter